MSIRRIVGPAKPVFYRTEDDELWDYHANAVARANYLALVELVAHAESSKLISTAHVQKAMAQARNVVPDYE